MINGVVAGRYRIERLLGEGGMSRVYEATDLRLGRTVAIKVVRDELRGDAEFAQRFTREARTAASLSHPNIVNIFDAGQDGDLTFIVMELVDGRPLREYIDSDAPFEVTDVVTLLDQLCDALDYAHSRGVVHRDVKPENVLITSRGQVKVGDFGLARSFGNEATLTGAGTVMGSAYYMSPEQAQGQPAGEPSDVYAAGIIAFEMLTGRRPFTGDSAVAVAVKHVETAPPRATRFNPRLPKAIDSVLLKALIKNPSQRYASAMELADAVATVAQPQAAAVAPAAVALPDPLGATMPMPVVRAGATAIALPRQLAPRLAVPTSSVKRARPNYVFGLAVALLGLAFVVLAFMAGQQVLHNLPAVPNIAPPSSSVRPLQPSGAGGAAAPAAGTDTATPTVTPTPTASETETLTPTITQTPTVTETPTVTQTPRATVTPRPTLTLTPRPAPPTSTPAPPQGSVPPSPANGQIPVPAVVGMTEAQAQQTIKDAGFTTSFPNYQSFTSQPVGYVLSQLPQPGTPANKGSVVYIAVRR